MNIILDYDAVFPSVAETLEEAADVIAKKNSNLNVYEVIRRPFEVRNGHHYFLMVDHFVAMQLIDVPFLLWGTSVEEWSSKRWIPRWMYVWALRRYAKRARKQNR